jgi:bifunctional NMN adenylyltransferase/nudix hydrolase
MRYDYLIFIGRFQPFHTGHESVIRKALELSDKVMVLVGSSYQPRTVRNPWDFNEREAMIRTVFLDEENSRILTFPLLDQTYNNQLWIKSVQELVAGVVNNKIASKAKIALIDHQKDNASEYLTQFPQWEREEVENYKNISSADIRKFYFNNGELSDALNTNVSIVWHC